MYTDFSLILFSKINVIKQKCIYVYKNETSIQNKTRVH
jgi:hypothetical protein